MVVGSSHHVFAMSNETVVSLVANRLDVVCERQRRAQGGNMIFGRLVYSTTTVLRSNYDVIITNSSEFHCYDVTNKHERTRTTRRPTMGPPTR